jgi:hypothetical protein
MLFWYLGRASLVGASCFWLRVGYSGGVFPVNISLNKDFQDFQDYKGRRRFKFGGYL